MLPVIIPFSIAILFGIIISGCLDGEDGSDETTLDIDVVVYSDDDVVLVRVMNGSIDWSDKELRVDNYRLTTSMITSDKGDEVEFVDPTGQWDPEEGVTYNLKFVETSSNKIIWNADVLAEDKNGGGVPTFIVLGSIDATTDQVAIKVIQGEIEWSHYKILVDGQEFETEAIISDAGETAVYFDPESLWDAEAGSVYNVKVVQISENRVIWADDIIATV